MLNEIYSFWSHFNANRRIGRCFLSALKNNLLQTNLVFVNLQWRWTFSIFSSDEQVHLSPWQYTLAAIVGVSCAAWFQTLGFWHKQMDQITMCNVKRVILQCFSPFFLLFKAVGFKNDVHCVHFYHFGPIETVILYIVTSQQSIVYHSLQGSSIKHYPQ